MQAGVASIALGFNSTASKEFSTALGYYSNASGQNSTALGYRANARVSNSIALGYYSNAAAGNAIAIGSSANASYLNSVAIGRNARTTASNQIVLGTSNDRVVIPGTVQFSNLRVTGKLEVEGDCELARTSGKAVWIGVQQENGKNWTFDKIRREATGGMQHRTLYVWKDNNSAPASTLSDRRLKNVGEVFTGGLDKIKQLKVYNYTFKDDETKTPQVGVIAQDLQKVFPNAVTKGNDGFLRIRMEDMFYALVNAVKELDSKVEALIKREQKIDELEKRIDKLEKRLAQLEKSK